MILNIVRSFRLISVLSRNNKTSYESVRVRKVFVKKITLYLKRSLQNFRLTFYSCLHFTSDKRLSMMLKYQTYRVFSFEACPNGCAACDADGCFSCTDDTKAPYRVDTCSTGMTLNDT